MLMKRIALIAAVFAVAACTDTETIPIDSTPAMAPAPMPMDSAHNMMMMDSARIADSIRADSIRRADSIATARKGGGG
jgi:hypothetical protein